MANSENLKRFTSSEARENGKKGGKKSAEVRRARKTLKDELLALLSDEDIQKKISTALLKKAQKGDTKAFEVIRDTIGEKPIDKHLNAETTPEKLNIVVDEAGIQKAIERTRNLAEDG